MDMKCIKTSVFVNENHHTDSFEQGIDIDFILPDYCPDIAKIFKCYAVPRVTSKSMSGTNITIDGVVNVTLLYADKKGELCSYEYLYPFSKNAEMPSECPAGNLVCKTRCEYINCRAVTGRKVDIHGAIGIYLKVFKRRSTDIVSDIDDDNIELLRGIAPATVPMGYAEKYLMIEDEIAISEGKCPIRNIIRTQANTCVKETKIINGKVVVKGDMTVCVLYCPEDESGPQSIRTVLPFSQIVDIEGITDSCSCETRSEIAFLEIKPRNSVSGESKSFSLTAKILLTCESYCGNDIAIILDAFSRKFEAEVTRKKICFEKIIANVNETYHCKKSIELEKPIVSVTDLWCNMQSCNTKFESNKLMICGTLVASIIVCDEDNNALYHEKPIDFEYNYPLNNANELSTLFCEPQLEILSCGFTMTSSNSVELQIDLGINSAIYEKKSLNLISELELDESHFVKKYNKCAMTVYFVGDNECVWDIARKFNASIDEIMNINALEEDCPSEGTMILIPQM